MGTKHANPTGWTLTNVTKHYSLTSRMFWWPVFCNSIFPSDCGALAEKTGYLFGDPDPDTKYGSVVSVSCDKCYQGPPTKTELTCQANGDWENAAGCTQIGIILQPSLSCLKRRFQMSVLKCQG